MKTIHIPRRFVRSDWGGTETVILETCRRLQKKGHGCEIFTTQALSTRRRETIAGVGVRRFPSFYPYFGLSAAAAQQLDRKGGNLFSVSLFRALLREPDLDLIHLHAGKRLGGIGRFVARRRGIPYVISVHGGAFDVPPEEARSWTEPTESAWEWGRILGWAVGSRRVFADAAAIICVGKAERDRMAANWPDRRVVWLPNGVDSARFATGNGAAFRRRFGIPPHARLILACGRIDPQKNQAFLVERLPELLRSEPETRLVLLGPTTNPVYAATLRKRVTELGVEAQVVFTGGLPPDDTGLVDAYAAADLFVLPSIHEPFGIVILEAWAAGVPVLASRVGGIPSFVTHDVEAMLFTVNDPASFHAELEALRDQGRVRRLVAAGRVRARGEFDWEVVTDRLIALYHEVYEDSLRS